LPDPASQPGDNILLQDTTWMGLVIEALIIVAVIYVAVTT
jgi:hypothetical protein